MLLEEESLKNMKETKENNMALPLILGPIISMLTSKGLDLAAQAIDGVGDKAVEFIEEKTGVVLEPNKGLSAKDVQAIKTIESNPELKIKLQEMALEKLKEQNRHTEVTQKQHNENTADARELQENAFKSDSWLAKHFVYIFASAWSVFAMVYIGFITFGTIPAENVRFADVILGFLLGTIIASIINYFVGSTKGSSDKNEAIHHVIKSKHK